MTRFTKGTLLAHYFSVHFLLLLDGYNNRLTVHVCTIAKSTMVCYNWGFFLYHHWRLRIFGWSINSPILSGQANSQQGITTWLVGETGHGLSYILWYVELKIAWIDAIWTYNVLSWIPTTLWLYITPTFHEYLCYWLPWEIYYLKWRAFLLTFQYGVDPLKDMNDCRLVENCIYKQFYAFLKYV